MPLYDFRCTNKECKTKVFEEFITMADVSQGCKCPQCEEKAARIFDNTPFTMDFTAGYDVGLGQHVGSARERDNVAATKNLRRIS